jgi:hypothetical protein
MATHWLPTGYPLATQQTTDQQPINIQRSFITFLQSVVAIAAMSVCTPASLFCAEPAAQHPLVGHADSDILLSYPKFDCIGKSMVMTKAGAIT